MSDGIETFDAKLFHLDKAGGSWDDLCVDDTNKHKWTENKHCWTSCPTHKHIFLGFIRFRSESLFSYLTAPSVTLHLMQTSPAAHAVACQQISICMGNVPKVSDRCLNKPTSRTYIHSYTALCLIYSIYTCIVHIHITNVPLQVMSNTLMWHRYTVCIPKDNG